MKKKPQKLKWDPLGCGPDIIYCDNTCCEAPAFASVIVSEGKAGDSTRNFCAPCAEAYTIGVQHGTLITLEELRAARRKRSRTTKG